MVEDVKCEELRQLLERAYSFLPGINEGLANIAGMRVGVDPAQPAKVITPAPDPVKIVTAGTASATCGSTTAPTTRS
jgi:hypothetical protein